MVRLGSIVVTAGQSKNNTNTATPFVIPSTIRGIWLSTTASGVTFRAVPDAAAPSTKVADANDFPLQGNVPFSETIASCGAPLVVAVYGAADATVNVYAAKVP